MASAIEKKRKGQKIVEWLNNHSDFSNQNEGCESWILERVSDEELEKVMDKEE